MIKVEIDVNVKGLDFLKGLLSAADGMVNTPAWTTNEVPKESIPQPVAPEQPAPQLSLIHISEPTRPY